MPFATEKKLNYSTRSQNLLAIQTNIHITCVVFTLQIGNRLAIFRITWGPELRQMRANICPVSRDKNLSLKKLSTTCLLLIPRFHSTWNLGKKALLNMNSCGFFLCFFLIVIYSNWIQSQTFLSVFFFSPSVWASVLDILFKESINCFVSDYHV